MEKAIKFICLICFLVFTACGGKKEQKEASVVALTPPYTIEIPAEISATTDSIFPLSEVASDVEFVQLEITDESLIRNIHGLKVSENYILVNGIMYVYLYDRSGKFITQIGSRGQGPSEFTTVSYAALDEKNGEIFLFTGLGGVKVYGLNGKYKRTIPDTRALVKSINVTAHIWNDQFFYNERIRLAEPKEDIWTWAVMDSLFRPVRKFYNPQLEGREKELNEQIKARWGEDIWTELFNEYNIDFYDNQFTMAYYAGDTIYRYNMTERNFIPEYILSFAKKPDFEASHQWGYTYTSFFDYYFPYDYVLSKNYLYLLLGHRNESFIARYNKKTGKMDYAAFENKLHTSRVSPQFTGRMMDITRMFFRNDISGGSDFRVDYRSEDGKCLIDVMNSEDIEKYIDMEKLKHEKVKDEASKQRLIDLMNRLSDDEQIIAIATLK